MIGLLTVHAGLFALFTLFQLLCIKSFGVVVPEVSVLYKQLFDIYY